jgi:hypothetical protein
LRQLVLQELQHQQDTLLEMDADAFAKIVMSAMTQVIGQYLHGRIDNIGAALQDLAIWQRMRQIAGNVLFDQVGGIQNFLHFVISANEIITPMHIRHQIPDGDIVILTLSPEWLMVAVVYIGGQPIDLDMLFLFPKKP